MNAMDLTAKLLATENLTVLRKNTKTASFDVSSRVLTLPVWKDMSVNIESLFIGHEVGHALFTTGDDWMNAIKELPSRKEQRALKGYINVVEDARIEKLMKRRFPGIRKSFFGGYKELLDRDFFKLKGRDVNTMLLIDRINLYFKGGVTLGIDFTSEEKVFVNRVDKAETIDEVIVIAKDLYEFSKAELEQKKEEAQEYGDGEDSEAQDGSEMEEVEYEFTDEDIEGEEMKDDTSESEELNPDQQQLGEELETSNFGGGVEDELESETDRNLNESLEELADDSITYKYYDLMTAQFRDPVVSYKKVLDQTKAIEHRLQQDTDGSAATFNKFMIESERTVNYLVKEFEMRKSAASYARTTVSKSGSLDTNKLHAYKLTDDIFKRVSSVANGKNHGMLFLLDWSGSMSDMMESTLKQVINLAMFCRRINIPFEVYAFTANHHKRHTTNEDLAKANAYAHDLRTINDRNVMFPTSEYALLNIFSSKMTNLEFKTSARRFSNSHIHYVSGYSLGSTPLNEALVYMLNFIPEYKRCNNIEKLTFITLTDGQGSPLRTNTHMEQYSYREDDVLKRYQVKHFVSDKVTGKDYEINAYSHTQTEVLLRMIKDRYDVINLGFYLCPNRRSNLNGVFYDHFGKQAHYTFADEMKTAFKAKGFYSLFGTGRDELFIVPDTSTKIIDDNVEVDSKDSAATIAKKFSKALNNKKQSRVLLDRFIGHVA